MKIVVNCISTKEGGGAFQIALNFIKQTAIKRIEDIEWFYVVSKDLDYAIGDDFSTELNSHYFVYPTQPEFLSTYCETRKNLFSLLDRVQPDVIYTTSSPCYFTFKYKEVMRFANAWITNPNKYAWTSLNTSGKIRMMFYILLQRYLIKKGKFFITQTDVVGKGLQKITSLPSSNICVVRNVLPAALKNKSTSHIVDDEMINIACVADYVPHKNIEIVKDVLTELHETHHLRNICFHLTINKSENFWIELQQWADTNGFQGNIENHGRLSQDDLSLLYRKCELCFLPSLLETFSATTIEAMYYKLPCVATDLDFNHDVFGDSCLYFRPSDSTSAANMLAKMITTEEVRNNCIKKMDEQLSLYNDYDLHFHSIISFLRKVANNQI